MRLVNKNTIRKGRKKLETQKRNHFVDVLKGICIIFVIFTHASWTDEQRVKLLFPFWIDMAVPFFMLVSGYVYTKSFQKNGIETLDSKNTFLKI